MLKSKWNYFFCLILIGSFFGCHEKTNPVDSTKSIELSPQQTISPSISKNGPKRKNRGHPSYFNKLHYTNLGFENLVNTCFANATFKLLLANPEFLDLINSTNNSSATTDVSTESDKKKKNKRKKGKKSGGIIIRLFRGNNIRGLIGEKKTADTIVTEDELRKKVVTSLNDLFIQYKSLERPEIDHPLSENKAEHYITELNSFYDQFDSYLSVKYGQREDPYFLNVQNGFIRDNQQDATEFLNEILDVSGFVPVFHQSFRAESADGLRKNDSNSTPLSRFDLPISDSNINSLSEAFDNFVKEETLRPTESAKAKDGGENLTQNKSRMFVNNLEQIPTYFFASLIRYESKTGQIKKVEKYIDSQSSIRMRIFEKYSSDEGSEWHEDANSITVEYEPIGFVVHSGRSPLHGHYYSYIYDDHSKSWFIHDDSNVVKFDQPNEIKEVWDDINSNGYIVLYREKKRVPAF